MPQSLSKIDSYLYADDTCIFFQDKDVQKIEYVLIMNSQHSAKWFVDNRLSIQARKDKTKCVLFSKTKRPSKLNISYGDHSTTQYHTVEYLYCHLDSNPSGESITMKVNEEVKFLYRKNKYLTTYFDYGCTSCFPLLTKNLKH